MIEKVEISVICIKDFRYSFFVNDRPRTFRTMKIYTVDAIDKDTFPQTTFYRVKDHNGVGKHKKLWFWFNPKTLKQHFRFLDGNDSK